MQFTDADLQAAFRRALRTIVILALIGGSLFALIAGWQSGVYVLVGAAVSGVGLYEWQQLVALINARLDNQKTPRSTGFLLVMFFLRLGIAAVVLYATLKCLHGSLYALIAGLALAVAALTIEAVRLVRS
ncbi:hypothetical protein D0Y96_005955 [Acidipila sp. 4G-K13]|uniref:ATP synthase subunit I n=1 Tax=Paracidobacterium acidisoli TaxID=2303751 RepID=A0A372ISU0_9BACT|nr:hypothetical protein [Paracidobacterium acidisoli]